MKTPPKNRNFRVDENGLRMKQGVTILYEGSSEIGNEIFYCITLGMLNLFSYSLKGRFFFAVFHSEEFIVILKRAFIKNRL